MSKPITIRIYKTHGKRVPMSRYMIYTDEYGYEMNHPTTPLVEDITPRMYEADYDKLQVKSPYKTLVKALEPKPSLLTKLKNKLRR